MIHLFMLLVLLSGDTASVHSFQVKTIDGKTFDFASLKGKKILVVNTASECGYTPQYADLQKLYQQYHDQLAIIAFPANNFGQQEPGTDAEIQTFCKKSYGVSFPIMSKVSVAGTNIHPLFRWLTSQQNPDFTGEIKWNFEKFLLDENGKLVRRFRSKTNPMSEEMINAITKH